MGERGGGRGRGDGRATSPVVGVVLLVALATVLAASVGLSVGLSRPTAAPQVAAAVQVTGTDGYPDGQVLAVTHEAGDPVPVEAVALVVVFHRTGEQARLSGFPTRRLTGAHVAGDDVFDASYAGVDGSLDAAHTDGTWASGERIAVRVAQGEYDLRAGEAVGVRVVHEPTGAVLVRKRARVAG